VGTAGRDEVLVARAGTLAAGFFGGLGVGDAVAGGGGALADALGAAVDKGDPAAGAAGAVDAADAVDATDDASHGEPRAPPRAPLALAYP
jgi:hypothetical protein